MPPIITSNRKRRELETEIAELREQLKGVKVKRDHYRSERDDLRYLEIFHGNPRTKLALELQGQGIEVGALHMPLPLPPGASAMYVDFRSKEDNILQNQDLDPNDIVETHYLCNGETLEVIDDESQDFVIANHMLEHCINPIQTVENFLRVTREGGYLYLSLPDKRYTFDYRRPVTPFEHILNDYQEKIEKEPLATYEEWGELVDPKMDAKRMHARQDNIHFHAWTPLEIIEMFHKMQSKLDFPISICEIACHANEVVILAKKGPLHETIGSIEQSQQT